MKELMISIISILSCVLTWQPSMQTQEEVGYVYHPDYFLEELAGKGVFVSEEMSETERFIAKLLMEVIDVRGDITDGYKQYTYCFYRDRKGALGYTYYQLQENSALKEFQAEVSDIPSNWGTGQPVDQEHLIYYHISISINIIKPFRRNWSGKLWKDSIKMTAIDMKLTKILISIYILSLLLTGCTANQDRNVARSMKRAKVWEPSDI